MCSILGLSGDHDIAPTLIESLKKMEYRGYDSVGVATVHSFTNYSHHSLNNSENSEFIPLRMVSGITKVKSEKHSKISDGISEDEREREQDNIKNVLKARDELEDAKYVVKEKEEEYTNSLEKHFDDSLP